jgi:hypothetical protein
MESLERSEPFPVDSVDTISVANSVSSFDESLARLLVSRTGTLQDRAQALLRSGFISRRYCEIEWVEIDQDEFPDAPNAFRVISAKFTNEGSGMKGTLSNSIEPNLKALCTDSTEIGLEFQLEAMLPTLDGNVFGRDFNISVEGDNAFIHAPTPAGYTHLAPESLAMIGEIIDTATLMPYRSN